MDRFSPNQVTTYHAEHLATFSTFTENENLTPRTALQKLFKLEKAAGIWSQRMDIQLNANQMWIVDAETNDVVERFPVSLIQQPTSFNDQNHIYNNILIFIVHLPNDNRGEIHIFQCVSHDAVNVVDDIYQWMRHYGITASSSSSGGSSDKPATTAASNVNVKEAVTVFNQIAAQREKKGASSDSIHRLPPGHQDIDSSSDSQSSFAESSNNNNRSNEIHESFSNERYVSILNHCFDDIERFIIRLQHAAAALRELQIRSHKRGAKGSGDGLLAIRARGPNEEEFFEILSKFKLAFNLLAKLKGCIHDPNAPELVHFLFTPLAIIIEAARSNEPPVDPSLVGIPYLSADAVELLSNCCTSKEYDLWQSLGLNWAQPVKHLRMTSPYQPIFTDGWAPSITEPELIGIMTTMAESENDSDEHPISMRPHSMPPGGPGPGGKPRDYGRVAHFDASDEYDDTNGMANIARGSPSTSNRVANTSPSPIESIERESPSERHMLSGEMKEYLAELQARNAKCVRVLFPRTANNNKELTVERNEILEVLDDSRKWWKARNSRGVVAHVPNTIVSEIEPIHFATSPGGHPASDDWIRRERQEPAKVLPTEVIIIQRPKLVVHKNETTNNRAEERKQARSSTLESELNLHFQTGFINSRQQGLVVVDAASQLKNVFVDEFNAKLDKLTEVNITAKDLLELLQLKDFTSEILDSIRKWLSEKSHSCDQLLHLSKSKLQKLLGSEIENVDLHRLHSNLVLIQNSIKRSGENELQNALKKRKQKLENGLEV